MKQKTKLTSQILKDRKNKKKKDNKRYEKRKRKAKLKVFKRFLLKLLRNNQLLMLTIEKKMKRNDYLRSKFHIKRQHPLSL